MQWWADWRCGILGCVPRSEPWEQHLCARCGAFIYSPDWVDRRDSALRCFYALEWRLREWIKAVLTVRYCYGSCGRRLPMFSRRYHCGDPACDDIPF